jgi:hypothetical protein
MSNIYRGEAVRQPCQTVPPTDITTWTLVGQLKAVDVTGVPTGAVLATATITKTAPLTGGYDVKFTSGHTDRTPANYFVDVWRTDSGSEQLLWESPVAILPYETRF